MAVSSRKVKNKRDSNGVLTGKAGTVYDVEFKYKTPDGDKTYSKGGFATKREASQHESEMRAKLKNPGYAPVQSSLSKTTVKEYLEGWLESYGKANLRPSTQDSYKGQIKNHIVPNIGHYQMGQVTSAMLDDLFVKLSEKGLSDTSVKYVKRVLSVSFETARKHKYVEVNPVKDITTKFGKEGKTPDPYTIQQMQRLMSHVLGTEWEMPVVLGGFYGLRLGEILGLRTDSIDLDNMEFHVVEQLPYKIPAGTKIVEEMAPTKAGDRILPITEVTLPYFLRRFEMIDRQKFMAEAGGGTYHDNHLFVCASDGAPLRKEYVSADWGQMIRRLDLPYLRFHDLRHTAATNMHELTGDFFTVGEILGHTLKGVGMALGISSNLEAVTSRYINVRLERKEAVLDAYHQELHKKNDPSLQENSPRKRKNREMDAR